MSPSRKREADVVFITRKWAPATGGMETYSMRLAERLATLVPLQVIKLPGRDNGMPPSAASLIAFPLRVVGQLLARQTPARVIHLGDMAVWPLGLLARRTTQVVISAHGTDVAYHRRSGLRGWAYGTYLRLGSRLLSRARVIANSGATAQVLKESGWKTHKVVPLAADPLEIVPAQTTGEFVLFAGRLVERKGCGWFIRQVLPHLPQGFTLKIAGTQWDESETAALHDPRVHFLGPQDPRNLARLYSSALCVIVPNIDVPNGEYEGFGLVAPEAAAAGGIVLASASGGLVDAVIEGETGFLLPSGDATVWAEKIREIANWSPQDRQTFIGRAKESSRAFYNWDRVAADTVAVYSLS